MASLDDEFARFEAELQSLEAQAPTTDAPASSSSSSGADGVSSVSGKKRAAEENGSDDSRPAKKPAGLAQPKVTTTVVAAKPKVYVAPPRPAPVKSSYDAEQETASESFASIPGAPLRPGVPNTVEDVAAHRGALSGFPMGAGYSSGPPPPPARAAIQTRVDMETGEILSAEETHRMNMQQSVYAYDPSRARTGGLNGNGKPKRNVRMAGGEIWEDQTLSDWPDNDFRLFCGDLGNEVSDEILAHAFSKYPSFQRARVVRDKFTHKSRGYGFVSFADAFDCAKALREMNGKYIGNRPVKISKSKWQERDINVAKKKMKKKNKLKHHLFS